MAPRKSSSRSPRSPRKPAGSALAHGSRPEQVYTRLRDLIVQGLVAPGSRIVETEIASRLGVSRTPVREALQRLQQEGYVMGAPGAQQSRLTVAPLTRDDVHELLDIVGSLEGLGARRAAELQPDLRKGLVRDLRALNGEFLKAGKASPVDHSRLYDADERFHRRVVEAGEGPRLIALHDAVKPQAERYIRMYISMLTGRHQVVRRGARRDHHRNRGRTIGRRAARGGDQLAARRRPAGQGHRNRWRTWKLVTPNHPTGGVRVKKLALLLLIPALFACDTKAKQQLVELAKADSLRQDSLLNVKNQLLNDMLVSTQFINDINAEIAKARSLPKATRQTALATPAEAAKIKEDRQDVISKIHLVVERLDATDARLSRLRRAGGRRSPSTIPR